MPETAPEPPAGDRPEPPAATGGLKQPPSERERDPTAAPPAEERDEAAAAATIDDDGSGGCLIATAAHGTELAPQVQRLREIRDNALLTTESGRAFMSAFGAAYYSFSPYVADLEREHPLLRQAAAVLVAPMLHALQVVGMAEPGSDASVAAYGALAIALVAGIYVAAPATGAWCAVRFGRGPCRGRGGRA